MEAAAPPNLLLAFMIGAGVALAAWRAGSLDRGGAVAAAVVGTCAVAAGGAWGWYLVLWFAIAALLSRFGRAAKARRTAGVLEPGDRRDAWQVLANGGVFAGCAALSALVSRDSGVAFDAVGRFVPMATTSASLHSTLALAAMGALVAAGADTWATETGTLGGGRPWSLRSRRRVPVGTSGSVTTIGTAGSIAGAVFLAALAGWVGVVPRTTVPALALAGVAGAFVDTVAGAWLQQRRWCPSCHASTERRVHDCGAATVHRGGLSVLGNDAINLLCTVTGAVMAVLLVALLGLAPGRLPGS